jgi:hypothetical protein
LSLARPPRLRDRLAARLWTQGLDEALAAGLPSEASAALAHRARKLTSLSHRRTLADTYRRILRDARAGVRPRAGRVSPRRGAVNAAGDELDRLVAILAEPGPVGARGAAQARLLLTDGAGPLYNQRDGDSLRARARSAADSLLLGPPSAG